MGTEESVDFTSEEIDVLNRCMLAPEEPLMVNEPEIDEKHLQRVRVHLESVGGTQAKRAKYLSGTGRGPDLGP